jgi:hypothetical protein
MPGGRLVKRQAGDIVVPARAGECYFMQELRRSRNARERLVGVRSLHVWVDKVLYGVPTAGGGARERYLC